MDIKKTKKVNFLKLQLSGAIFALIALLISGFFIFGPSLTEVVRAIANNYDKNSGDSLGNSDWNNLLVDFLSKDGGSQVDRGDGTMVSNAMQGNLDMGNNKIENIGAPTDLNDAATMQYVLDNAGGGGVGDTFVNWGRADCPAGATELYDGYAMGSSWEIRGGGANDLCVKFPLSDTEYAPQNEFSGRLFTTGLGADRSMPAGVPEFVELKCAMCYVPSSTCYENYGDTTCGAGFNRIYTGWIMGELNNINRVNQSNWNCMNDDFTGADASNEQNADLDSMWYAATMEEDNDIGLYILDSYMKCSMCCN